MTSRRVDGHPALIAYHLRCLLKTASAILAAADEHAAAEKPILIPKHSAGGPGFVLFAMSWRPG
jgi:hypothetical protein